MRKTFLESCLTVNWNPHTDSYGTRTQCMAYSNQTELFLYCMARTLCVCYESNVFNRHILLLCSIDTRCKRHGCCKTFLREYQRSKLRIMERIQLIKRRIISTASAYFNAFSTQWPMCVCVCVWQWICGVSTVVLLHHFSECEKLQLSAILSYQ